MTAATLDVIRARIIPYQELLGNYDRRHAGPHPWFIIPYQELLGNYDGFVNLSN